MKWLVLGLASFLAVTQTYIRAYLTTAASVQCSVGNQTLDTLARPSGGQYDGQTWGPNDGAFPTVGNSYTDPVFGGVVHTLTDTGATGEFDNYTYTMFNADRTVIKAGTVLRNRLTGASVCTGVPSNDSGNVFNFHPTDADVAFYTSASSYIRYNISTCSPTTIKTFGGTLDVQGGAVNKFDRTARYFTVRYSGTTRVWDRQDDNEFTGTISAACSDVMGITPDGTMLVCGTYPNITVYPVNLSTEVVTTTSYPACTMCDGGHMALLSATNGKNYAFSTICNGVPNDSGHFYADLSIDQTGRSFAEQQADGYLIFSVTDCADTFNNHHSCAVTAGYDWCAAGMEGTTDGFGTSYPTPWRRGLSEVVFSNPVTQAFRRIAHHRSRTSGYYSGQIKPSVSHNGLMVAFGSNFNVDGTPDGSDLYWIDCQESGAPPAPLPWLADRLFKWRWPDLMSVRR